MRYQDQAFSDYSFSIPGNSFRSGHSEDGNIQFSEQFYIYQQ